MLATAHHALSLCPESRDKNVPVRKGPQRSLLVLLAVDALGGEADKKAALDYLSDQGFVALDEERIKNAPSRNELLWRNKLAFRRQDLVKLGHLSGGRRNVWAITDAGRAALDELSAQARASASRADWLTPRALEFLEARATDGATADPSLLAQRVERLLERGALPPPRGQEAPASVVKETTLYKRDPQVKAWVILAAAGVCELCRTPAPFEARDGTPYLEVHHVVPLASHGPDTLDNAVAICPNCHRELHHGRHAAERREALYDRVPRLRRPVSARA